MMTTTSRNSRKLQKGQKQTKYLRACSRFPSNRRRRWCKARKKNRGEATIILAQSFNSSHSISRLQQPMRQQRNTTKFSKTNLIKWFRIIRGRQTMSLQLSIELIYRLLSSVTTPRTDQKAMSKSSHSPMTKTQLSYRLSTRGMGVNVRLSATSCKPWSPRMRLRLSA